MFGIYQLSDFDNRPWCRKFVVRSRAGPPLGLITSPAGPLGTGEARGPGSGRCHTDPRAIPTAIDE
jgi:hypothetical protein